MVTIVKASLNYVVIVELKITEWVPVNQQFNL